MTTKDVNQDRYQGPDRNLGPPEYKTGPRYLVAPSVSHCNYWKFNKLRHQKRKPSSEINSDILLPGL